MRQTFTGLHNFIFILFTVFIVGCSNPLGSGKSEVTGEDTPAAANGPAATGTTASFDEDLESSSITLPYTSSSGFAAVSCAISDLSNVTVTQACTCAAGVCTTKVQGTANYNGAGSFNFKITDSKGTESNSAQAVLTINPVNDAPTLAAMSAQSTDEDVALALSLTVADVDGALTCSSTNFSATSSNLALLPVANIVFTGTWPTCTATMTPLANESGTSTIEITLTDGTLTAQQSFTLTVNTLSDPPLISNVLDQTIDEDTATGVAFTISDTDSVLTCAGSVTATSSNTAIIANGDIVITGTAPDCTATITPIANANGTSTISLTVTDGTLTAVDPFVATVTPVNDAPVLSDIADQSIPEDAATGIAFTLNDVDSTMTCAGSVSGSSSDTAVIANSGIVITGTAPLCTVTLTPVSNITGTSTITLTATDGALTGTDSFVATVSAVNDAPVISDITDQTIVEDTATGIVFMLTDVDSTLTCAGSVTGTSSDTAVIANGGIVITGTAPNCTATITPVFNANGTSTITLTASDGTSTGDDSFLATITAVNDAPVIGNITDQSIPEDTATGIAFTLSDVDSTVTCAGSVTGTSSDTAVIPNASVVITGTAPTCTVTLTPVTNTTGTSTITLTATDGALTGDDTFVATVSARPDLVSVTVPPNGVYGLGSSIIFKVTYDMNVIVTGFPRIALTVGASTAYATYTSGSNSPNLFFTYTVGAGQNDADGIAANAALELNGGTMTGSGNNCPLDMTGLIASLVDVRVNTALAPPGAVATLTQTNLSADRTQASFTWGVPTPGGAAISEYRVQYRIVGTVDFTTASPAPTSNTVTLTGLTTEVNYEVRVAAFNGVIGPYSSLLAFSTIFTPRSLNARVWYEAKDINGTGVVPANGVSISTLVDKSGNGNNAPLRGGETAGVIQTTNGQKVLRVSNATYQTASSLGETANTDAEVYLVAKVNAVINSFAFVNENQANGNRFGSHFPWGDGKAYIDFPMTDRISNNWGGNTSDIFAWTFRSSTTQGRALERNGVTVISAGNKTTSPALKKWSFFGNTTGGENWSADFVAVFVFAKVLTPTQRQEFFNYIETNYGVVMP